MIDPGYIERKGAERGKPYWQQVRETVYVSLGVAVFVFVLHLVGVLK